MASIYLRYGYRGHKSNERFIPSGTYDDHDPRVKDIVAYLVKNGHATIIESESVPIDVTEIEFEPFEPLELTSSAQDAVDESDIDSLYDDLQDYFEGSGIGKIGIGNVREYLDTL